MSPYPHCSYLPSSRYQQTLLNQDKHTGQERPTHSLGCPKQSTISVTPVFHCLSNILLFLPCLWGHNLNLFEKLYLRWKKSFGYSWDCQVVLGPRELFPSCCQPGLISPVPANEIDSVWLCSPPVMGGHPHGILVPKHKSTTFKREGLADRTAVALPNPSSLGPYLHVCNHPENTPRVQRRMLGGLVLACAWLRFFV